MTRDWEPLWKTFTKPKVKLEGKKGTTSIDFVPTFWSCALHWKSSHNLKDVIWTKGTERVKINSMILVLQW